MPSQPRTSLWTSSPTPTTQALPPPAAKQKPTAPPAAGPFVRFATIACWNSCANCCSGFTGAAAGAGAAAAGAAASAELEPARADIGFVSPVGRADEKEAAGEPMLRGRVTKLVSRWCGGFTASPSKVVSRTTEDAKPVDGTTATNPVNCHYKWVAVPTDQTADQLLNLGPA